MELWKWYYPMNNYSEANVASGGTWKDENTFMAVVRFYESPFTMTMTLTFEGDDVKVDTQINVSFGENAFPTLIGHKRDKINK